VIAQHLSYVAHPERKRGRIVDDDVPLLSFEWLDLMQLPITLKLRHALRQTLIAASAVEDSHAVPARQRVPHLVRTGEACAAQDENL